jgi:hypothetical protein
MIKFTNGDAIKFVDSSSDLIPVLIDSGWVVYEEKTVEKPKPNKKSKDIIDGGNGS